MAILAVVEILSFFYGENHIDKHLFSMQELMTYNCFGLQDTTGCGGKPQHNVAAHTVFLGYHIL